MDASKSGKKRPKAYYGHKSAKKRRLGHLGELKAGMQGVLVTTGDQEKLCVSEAYSLLNEYGDELYGVEDCLKAQEREEGSEEDIASAVAAEVEQLRGAGGKEGRRFQSVITGANHVVFIHTREPVEPCALVHHMLSQLLTGAVRKSRFCQRFVPVVKVCHATLDDIRKYADAVLKEHFHTSNQHKLKFAIHYKARNNNELKRDDVIKLLAAMVTKDGEFPHPVDLSHPELTIMVEVVKNLCCMSVVRDFNKLGKYNINSVLDSVAKPADTAATLSDSTATQGVTADKTDKSAVSPKVTEDSTIDQEARSMCTSEETEETKSIDVVTDSTVQDK